MRRLPYDGARSETVEEKDQRALHRLYPSNYQLSQRSRKVTAHSVYSMINARVPRRFRKTSRLRRSAADISPVTHFGTGESTAFGSTTFFASAFLGGDRFGDGAIDGDGDELSMNAARSMEINVSSIRNDS